MGFDYIKNSATKALYLFEGSLTTDSSGNGNTLSNSGTVSLTNNGRFGQGADFGDTVNNGKYLYNGGNLGATLSSDITISLWFYPRVNPTDNNQRLMDYRTGTAYLLINYVYFQSKYTLRINANGTNASYDYQFPLNKWYLITITISTAGTLTLYVDGFQRATGTRAPASVGNTFYLGNCLVPANFNVGAIYDTVIIEQKLWSAVEVQKYYTNALGRFATL